MDPDIQSVLNYCAGWRGCDRIREALRRDWDVRVLDKASQVSQLRYPDHVSVMVGMRSPTHGKTGLATLRRFTCGSTP